MNEISAMPSAIAEWLSGREELSRIRFLTEFPPVKKAVPLKKVTVAVGISSIIINDTFEQSEDTSILETEEYCRSALITLRFSIHAPFSQGGKACHEAFADIIDCLTFDSGLDITESGCGLITSDRDTQALVLTATAKVNTSLCPAQSTDLIFPSFLDKTLLCGSHIRNDEIHLSSAEKAYLGQPFTGGTYTGTGAASRSISLGFRPAAIILFAPGMPFEQGGRFYSGFGFGGGATEGLEITQSGFRVTDSSSGAGTGACFNEAGITYTYMAFRAMVG